MKKAKTILIAAMLAMAMITSTAGCVGGTGSETSSQTTTAVSTTEQSETVNAGETNFDFDEVCKNIVINGKQYTFPFSVEELGEGYSLGKISYSKLESDDEYYSVLTDLYYKNEKVAWVGYYGINNNEKENNSIDFTSRKIDDLDQDIYDSEKNYIEFGGLKIGDSADKILKLLGTPNEIKGSNDTSGSTDTHGSYIYSQDGGKNITYMYKDNTIDCIILSFNNNY